MVFLIVFSASCILMGLSQAYWQLVVLRYQIYSYLFINVRTDIYVNWKKNM
jgi:hypothetical protein